jgi:Trk-type K+ transport system membrane component
MGIGVSIFLIAVGAILAFAVNVQTQGFNLNVVGIILMIVGGLGLLLSLLFWSSMPWSRREETIIENHHMHDAHGHAI